jgi:hypothetical protein
LKRWSCLARLKRGALPSRRVLLFPFCNFFFLCVPLFFSFFFTCISFFLSLFCVTFSFFFLYSNSSFDSFSPFHLYRRFMPVVFQTIPMRLSEGQIIHPYSCPYLCINVLGRLLDEKGHHHSKETVAYYSA